MQAFYDKPKKVAFFCVVPMNTDITPIFDEYKEKFALANKNGTHVTLLFKPKGLNKEELLNEVGSEVTLKPLYILAREGQGVTMVLEIDKDVYRGTSLPHVTIGTGVGYPPNVSNQIIQDWLSGNSEDIKYIETDVPEFKGTISAAIYGKGGKCAYVSRRDWVC